MVWRTCSQAPHGGGPGFPLRGRRAGNAREISLRKILRRATHYMEMAESIIGWLWRKRDTTADSSRESASAAGGCLSIPAAEADKPGPDESSADMGRMVRGLAGRLHARLPRGCGIEIADLIQAGNVGLLKAAGSFEEGYGAPLACYAKFRIRGEMLDMVRRSAEREKCGSSTGPSREERPELEASVSNASENSPQSSLLRQQRSAIIWEEIRKLPRRDQSVIRLRYSREMTLREIGHELQVNESRACQLHQSALTRLKRALARRGVKDFSHL